VTWRCTYCGRESDIEDPPCETCGRETFERVGDDAGSAFRAESFVWVCARCGREHVKHPKICSSCSHSTVEKRPLDRDGIDDELSVPGYLDVGWPYLLGAGAVVAVVVLALTGVIPVPGVGGPPPPPDAPGQATAAAGLELRTVEDELRADFAAERAGPRESDDGLDALATAAVRHEVASRYDAEYEGAPPEARNYDLDCRTELGGDVVFLSVSQAEFRDEAALAAAIADRLLERSATETLVTREAGAEGIEIHVTPEATIAVGYVVC